MATTSLNPNLTLIESALSKDDIMKINLYYKDGTFYNEREGTPSDIIKDIDINNFYFVPTEFGNYIPTYATFEHFGRKFGSYGSPNFNIKAYMCLQIRYFHITNYLKDNEHYNTFNGYHAWKEYIESLINDRSQKDFPTYNTELTRITEQYNFKEIYNLSECQKKLGIFILALDEQKVIQIGYADSYKYDLCKTIQKEIRKFNKDLYILLLTGHKDLAPPLETIKRLEIQGYCEKSDKFDQLLLLIESGIKSIEQMNTFFNEDTIKLTKTEMHSVKREFIRMQLAEDDTYEDDYLDNNELYRSLLKDALINKTHEQRTYLIREKKFQIISTIKEDILLS